MKNSLFRKALTTLLVLTFLCSIFVAFNYFTVREKIFAETITVGSLEQGDVVEQANYCTTFGGKVAVTNTLASDSDPGNGKNYALNGANAIKFNVKLNSANTWNHYYTLFTPKSDSAYWDAPRFNFYVSRGNTNSGKFSFAGEDSVLHALPDNVDFASAGASYDIEIGGLGIYNGSSEYKGTYYYFKINDSLVYEYYKYGDAKPTGTYFNVAANSTSVTYTGTYKTVTVGSLTKGDVVEQANFCSKFGDKVAVTNTLANDGDPGSGKNYALNGANAIKFNVKLNSANTWNHYYTLFTPKSDSAYWDAPRFNFYVAGGAANANKGNFSFAGENSTLHALPDNVDFASAGASYDIEIGGLGIYNGSSEYKGTYYYFKINDSLIYEYYKYGEAKPTGTYFNVAANSTSVTYIGAYEAVTVGSLTEGDVVEQANFCTMFGDNASVTNTLAKADDPGNGVNYPLNGANAVKFNVKLNSANIWNHYYTLFTPKSNSAYYDAPRYNFYVSGGNPNSGKFSFAGEDSVLHDLPGNVDFASEGASYDIEIGGLGIYNGSSEYQGTYYYFKINDSLVYEYYKYGDAKPTGTYFNVAANSTSVTYTGVEQVIYTVKTVVNGQESSQKVIKGNTFVLPAASLEDNVFVGWVNDDNLYYEGKTVEVNGDVTYTAKFVKFVTECGAQARLNEKPALRFIFRIASDDRSGLTDLVSSVSFGAKITSLDKSGYLLKDNIENWFALNKNYDGVEFDVYTVALTNFNVGDVDYSDYRFVPNGIMKIEYSDGTVKSFNASGESFSRSLAEVCSAVVSDCKDVADSEYNVLYDGKYYRDGLTVSGIEYAIDTAKKYRGN